MQKIGTRKTETTRSKIKKIISNKSFITMGLLKESRTLTWEETQKKSAEVKKRGAEYFSDVYANVHPSKIFGFLWGEELEQNLVIEEQGNWVLLPASDLVLQELKNETDGIYNIEYARYMIETTPSVPYEPRFSAFAKVEQGMEIRRKTVEKALESLFKEKKASVLSLPCFPLLGDLFAFGTNGKSAHAWSREWSEAYEANEKESAEEKDGKTDGDKKVTDRTEKDVITKTSKQTEDKTGEKEDKKDSALSKYCQRLVPSFKITRSRHFPDFAITWHRRFHDFTKNIRLRKGAPLHFEILPAKIEKEGGAWNKGASSVVIDSMGQGMGCCCLQLTMQSESLDEARFLYDSIGAICPLLLFLTMGTAAVSGTLTESSTRWDIVAASVDCRKEEESFIKKSRYSSIDLYVSDMPEELYSIYNDINPYLEKNVLDILISRGVDKAMAHHIASLYIRDPILCYEDSSGRDDFENIQSSNWRSMRLKPPKEKIGGEGAPGAWLVEVRPMEIQPTSFENTAYLVFVVMFSRMVLSLNTVFYLPISKVDENFRAANSPSNVPKSLARWMGFERSQKFWYRENIFESGPPVIKYGTVEEIFLGTGSYCGILGAIERYLSEYAGKSQLEVEPYLQFIRDRVTGRKTSVATYVRKFVSKHPEYKGDSVISRTVSNDLVSEILKITENNTSDYLIRDIDRT